MAALDLLPMDALFGVLVAASACALGLRAVRVHAARFVERRTQLAVRSALKRSTSSDVPNGEVGSV